MIHKITQSTCSRNVGPISGSRYVTIRNIGSAFDSGASACLQAMEIALVGCGNDDEGRYEKKHILRLMPIPVMTKLDPDEYKSCVDNTYIDDPENSGIFSKSAVNLSNTYNMFRESQEDAKVPCPKIYQYLCDMSAEHGRDINIIISKVDERKIDMHSCDRHVFNAIVLKEVTHISMEIKKLIRFISGTQKGSFYLSNLYPETNLNLLKLLYSLSEDRRYMSKLNEIGRKEVLNLLLSLKVTTAMRKTMDEMDMSGKIFNPPMTRKALCSEVMQRVPLAVYNHSLIDDIEREVKSSKYVKATLGNFRNGDPKKAPVNNIDTLIHNIDVIKSVLFS